MASNITLLLFAQPREVVGSEKLEVQLPTGATFADLKCELQNRHAELGPLLASCRFAVDGVMVADSQKVPLAREIALIPPVSGG